jgi:predicted secreted protein
MKKLMAIFVSVAMVSSLLIGCGGVKVYTDPSQIISVKVGEEFIIALAENPTIIIVGEK